MKPRRRLLHWLLHALTLLSLLLCLATAGLWVRSYWVADSYFWADNEWFRATSCRLSSDRGALSVQWATSAAKGGGVVFVNGPYGYAASAPSSGWISPTIWNRLGFGIDIFTDDRDMILRAWTVIVPHWLLMLVAGSGGCLSMVRTRRARRRAQALSEGLCRRCGYDLRATPERCPECGTIVEHPKEAVSP